MLQLDGRALTFGCVGAVIGAAIVGAAWIIVSGKAEPEPASRHTLAYDQCLASGRSKTACDAMMRVIEAKRQSIRNQLEQDCRHDEAQRGQSDKPDKDNPFAKIIGQVASLSMVKCLENVQARIDSLSFEFK